MDRDEALESAARLDELGVSLSAPQLYEPPTVDRPELVARVARELASPRLHPVLVGESGVGKTVVMRLVAQAMARHDRAVVPPELRGRRVIHVTASELISGALFVNQLEHKLRQVAKNAAAERAVIYFDDLANYVGAGAASDNPDSDILALLLPFVRRGELRIAAATTARGLSLVVQRHPAFARLLTPIDVPEATRASTALVLNTRGPWLAASFGARLTPDAIEEAIELSERLYPWKRLPGKACDLVDAALASATTQLPARGAQAAVSSPIVQSFDRPEIALAVHRLTGVAEFLLAPHRPAPRTQLRQSFDEHVVGQEHVIEPILERIQMIKSRLCAPGRPLAAFLLAGPSGVGKTLVARTVARLLLGREERLIRLDMSEYSASDAAGRFAGEGHGVRRHTGLVDAALVEPMPVVLLDEIEKAHPSVLDLLLQLLGEGRLSDDLGRTAHFTNAIIMMTSNLGADRRPIEHPRASSEEGVDWQARVREAASRAFRPELVNRLSGILAFRPLTREQVAAVARREIERLGQRTGLRDRAISFRLAVPLFERVIEAGYDRAFGARPMERAVDTLVGAPVATFLAERPTAHGVALFLDLDPSTGLPRARQAARAARVEDLKETA